MKDAQQEDFEQYWLQFWNYFKAKHSANVALFESVVRSAFWGGWLQRRQFERDRPGVYTDDLRK